MEVDLPAPSQEEVDNGYLITLLSLLLLATTALKEVYRLTRHPNTPRIRIEAMEVQLGWFLRDAFLSETYPNFPPPLSTTFLLCLLLTFVVEFVYPCLAFTFTASEKLQKYAVVAVWVGLDFSPQGILCAYLLQTLCLFLRCEDGRKLGSIGCCIEVAYILLVTAVFEHLLLSPSHGPPPTNTNKYALLLVFGALLQVVHTYTKSAAIAPFPTPLADPLQKLNLWLRNAKQKRDAPEDRESESAENSNTSARQELQQSTEMELKINETI